jgi:hypothetical protein
MSGEVYKIWIEDEGVDSTHDRLERAGETDHQASRLESAKVDVEGESDQVCNMIEYLIHQKGEK